MNYVKIVRDIRELQLALGLAIDAIKDHELRIKKLEDRFNERYLTTVEAAELMDTSRQNVLMWKKKGHITPAYGHKRKGYFWRESDLLDYMRTKNRKDWKI